MPRYLVVGGLRGGDVVDVPQCRHDDLVELEIFPEIKPWTPEDTTALSADLSAQKIKYRVSELRCGSEFLHHLRPDGWTEFGALQLVFKAYRQLAKLQHPGKIKGSSDDMEQSPGA